MAYKIDTRYFIFQIRAPEGHDTTFIISTYTINKVKYNNYFIISSLFLILTCSCQYSYNLIENKFVNRKLDKRGVVRATSACEIYIYNTVSVYLYEYVVESLLGFNTTGMK